ncbi:hypothetical protein ABIA99_005273 [Bradyrhizobium sp. LB12.1]|uniref:hypothetical protein n=1 Tax=Bradyrhizobium sp. LB12.1 TaxID=3156327 RepID=UPI003391EAE5
MIDPGLVKWFRDAKAHAGEIDISDLAPLQNVLEIIGLTVETARQSGEIDEADAVELVLMDLKASRQELRAWARDLKRLGYLNVADRVGQMASASRVKPRPSFKQRWGLKAH